VRSGACQGGIASIILLTKDRSERAASLLTAAPQASILGIAHSVAATDSAAAAAPRGNALSSPDTLCFGHRSQDMQRPLYMRPAEAIEYGLIDEIIAPNRDKQAAAAAYWIKSGRAESEGRLEQWVDYLQQQELYNLKDAAKKTLAQEYRASYRCAGCWPRVQVQGHGCACGSR
jgi:hypothetical protein